MTHTIRMPILAAAILGLVACDGETTDDGGDENQAPTANAGDDFTVEWGRTVLLSGRCDDADTDDIPDLIFSWSIEAAATGSSITTASLSNTDTRDAYFDPDEAGDYTVGLTCDDGKVAGSIDLVVVTVEAPPPNRDPVVDAGEDATFAVGDTLNLSATASDQDGDALTYAWTIVDAPAPSVLTTTDIQNADAAQASVLLDAEVAFIFQVEVTDGRGGSATDMVTITGEAVDLLAGSLQVTVLDRNTLAPIEGATLAVGDVVVTGATDATGLLTYDTDPLLTGPVDVTVRVAGNIDWDHDGDPITPAVSTPRYRMTTMTGVNRPAVTILAEQTGATETGEVTGVVPINLYGRLPDHTLDYPSIDLVTAGTFSGQVRLVLVTPILPVGGGSEIEIRDLLASSPSGDVPFPGNMTTDDSFFNDYGVELGREPGPGGEPPFTAFTMRLPAGTQRLAVVGGIGTLDLSQLIPLFLSGLGEGALGDDLGVVLSAIDLKTLFVGVISVDVPAGGTIDISTTLADTTVWADNFEEVAFGSLVEAATITDPLDPGIEYELQQLRVFPEDTITVASTPPGADPRVEANLPATVEVEVFCGAGMLVGPCEPTPTSVTVPVPDSTLTDVPFAMNVLLMTIPPGHTRWPEGGAVPVGFRFAKTPRSVWSTTEFGVPPMTGTFTGLTFEAVSFAFRRLAVRESDGSFLDKPGKVTDSAAGLGIDSAVSLDAGGVLPVLAESGGGLEVSVLVDLDDLTVDPSTTPANIELAQGVVVGLMVPDAANELPASLTVTGSEPVGLRVLTVRTVDRAIAGGEVTPAVTPVWDVLYAGQATDLAIPNVPMALGSPWPGSATELQVSLTGYRFRGTFSYQDATPATRAHRRIGLQADAWSFDRP